MPGAGGRVVGAAAVPTYDPWAWVVFGREIVGPGPGLGTVSGTGWKPLAVPFTAPLGLFGSAGPSLWLVVVRCAGLVAMLLAFRLAARVDGIAAGALAALALLACSQWLRFLSAGNVEPLVAGTGAVPAQLIDGALASLPTRLNDEQAAVVRTIATSGNAVDVVEALAGTGKTMVAGALAAVYQRAGYRVVGASPTGRAARELSSRAGVPASTLHRLADDLEHGEGFGSGRAVLLVDEAGMAPTRVSAGVLAAAHDHGVKVVAVGDSGQLSSVEAGGWLGALSQRLGAHELHEVVRQRDPAERHALAELHERKPDAWITLKQGRRELVVHHGGPEAAHEAVMAAWRAEWIGWGPSTRS